MTDQLAQSNMVKQQIRTWGVTEPHLVDLLETIPREHFVPAEYQSLAYAEAQIPLAHGQEMMMPSVAARLLQAINIKGTDKICQIGTGSGFLTALMARLGHHVYAVDLHQSFNQTAQQKCSALGINNVISSRVTLLVAGLSLRLMMSSSLRQFTNFTQMHYRASCNGWPYFCRLRPSTDNDSNIVYPN